MFMLHIRPIPVSQFCIPSGVRNLHFLMHRSPLTPRPITRLAAISRSMNSSPVSAEASSAASKGRSNFPDEVPVLFESAYSSRTFILNRPKSLNALDQGMIDLISPKIQEWDNSDLCKIIVSKGNGRAYCAGGDVRDVIKNIAKEETRHKALAYFKDEFQLDYDLATLQKPYISIMDGITMGGGVGLSAYARFRIATPATVFAMPETKIGYYPDVGSTYILSRPRMDGEVGTYLALTGESIKGYEVFRLGLATHYVDASVIPILLERLGGLEDVNDKIINETIEEFSLDVDAGKENGLDQLRVSVGPVRVALDVAFGESDIEGIVSTLEKFSQGAYAGSEEEKEIVKKWASETLEFLNMRSPTSLRVAFEAVRRASKEDWRLSDSLQMELGIAGAFSSGISPDLLTGVTAVVIDKLKSRPAWSPSTLAETSQSQIISAFFDRSSPYVSSAPRLQTSRTSAQIDLSHYALPTESEIRALIMSDNGGENALTSEEAVQRFESMKKGKKGVRAKVDEVIARQCEKFQGEYLRWKTW